MNRAGFPSSEHDRWSPRCAGCGYDLRGLPPLGRCPECGLPVQVPLLPDDALSSMPIEVIRAFRLASWMGSACVLALVFLLLAVFIPGTSVLELSLLLALSLAWMIAVCRLTPTIDLPQAAARGFSRHGRRRRVLRWLQLGWVLVAAVLVFREAAPTVAARGIMPMLLAGGWGAGIVLGLTGLVLLSLQLEQLADWARDEDAQNAFDIAAWGVPVTTLLFTPIALSLFWSVGNPVRVVVIILSALWVIALSAFPFALLSLSKSMAWSVTHAREHQDRLRRRYDRTAEYHATVSQTVATMDEARATRERTLSGAGVPTNPPDSRKTMETMTVTETTDAKPTEPIRTGVVGVGRMGRHHARVYAQSADAELVGVVDVNVETRERLVQEWGGRAFATVEELLDAGVDAVSIATPTVAHRAAAERLLEAKVACLIEKPLAPDAATAEVIAETAERSGAVLQVGHIVRYDPVMVAIRKIGGLTPRFIEMDRISPMTFRSVDVGVVLDMMIHDLDLLLMLMGDEPEDVQASAVSVLGEAEDVCNARLTFPPSADGLRCVANVTASRLALKTERKLRIISEDAYISADFVKGAGVVVRKTANAEQLQGVRARLRAGEDLSSIDYLDLVQVDQLDVNAGEPLKLQIDAFLANVRSGARPAVDARAGFAAVRTAERIVEAARQAGSRRV